MPFASEAQRRLGYAEAAKGKAWAKEFVAADTGGKLPERLHPKRKRKPQFNRKARVR
jgi:hypothetical protein